MNKSVNPVIIAVAVVALAAFCYFMYRMTTPQLTGPNDPRNGPPSYARPGGGGGGPQAPGGQAAPPGPAGARP